MLERHPGDRAVREGDFAQGEQTIELVETEEVPVISKVARVVEEVHLGVAESERTEVIHETVRHTEVEIEPVEPGETNAKGGSQVY